MVELYQNVLLFWFLSYTDYPDKSLKEYYLYHVTQCYLSYGWVVGDKIGSSAKL